jgi:diguanylate cyclase (GGDEF)-like protein
MATDASKIAITGFEIVEELGRGATTAVFRALRHGESYAVKIQELTGPADPARIVFRREAAILAAIRHPSLGKVYEVGDDGRISYLVMELIAGQTLAETVEEDGALSEARVLSVATDVASALDAAHRVGLVHRDVSPRNIVLRGDGRAILIDFGLATTTGTKQPDDAVIGTVLYSAPEQTGMMRRPVDRRSDLYSLGAVLYEAVTGRPPFLADDAGEVVHLHATAEPPFASHVRPGVSTQLSRVICKLLAKDPDDRYQDASSLLADFEAIQRGTLAENGDLGCAFFDQGTTDAGLVGRDHELQALSDLLEECRLASSGGAALLEGEPGGGRTRIANELGHRARAKGYWVIEASFGLDHPGPLGVLATSIGRFFSDLEVRGDDVAALRRHLGLDRPGTVDSLAGLSLELDRYLSSTAGVDTFHEFAVIEMAHLLMALAAASPAGALLLIDNAHLADDSTHRVLGYLAPELDRLGLVVMLTSRNDPASTAALHRLRGELADSVRRHIELPALRDEDVETILTWQLGGGTLEPRLASEITLRANGNPAAAVEYLRSALDAGVLRPSWGTFSVDGEALASLNLPSDVLGLALRRLDGLRPATRWLLTEAAVIGPTFAVELLARITSWPIGDVYIALGEAATARVVEAQGAFRYAFLNDGVRETLVSSLDPVAGKRANEMLARALETSGDTRPDAVYEVARHYALGEVAKDPKRAFTANHRAAKLALAAQADDDALSFLATAADVASTFRLPVEGGFETDCGMAFARTGRIREALDHYAKALTLESDGVRRAVVHLEVARVHVARSNGGACIESAMSGLRELGHPMPRHAVGRFVSTWWRLWAAMVVGVTRVGFGRSRPAARQTRRIECQLLALLAEGADLEQRRGLALAATVRSLLPANRLGGCREHVVAYSALGRLLGRSGDRGFPGRRRTAKAVITHVRKVADRTGHHPTIADAKLAEAALLESAGECVRSELLLEDVVRDDARWLRPGEYIRAMSELLGGLVVRGRILEQVAWLDEARWHTAALGKESSVTGLDFLAVAVAGLLEQPTVGVEQISKIEERLAGVVPSPTARAAYQAALALFHFGLNELGEPFEHAVNEFKATGIAPKDAPQSLAVFYVAQAYARVGQALAAPEDAREELERLAAGALKDLRKAARTPILKAHYAAAKAGWHIEKGDFASALEATQQGQAILVGLDGPGAEVALLMARARALLGIGHPEEAERTAVAAGRLAEDLGLNAFVRWVRPDLPDRPRLRYVSQGASLGNLGSFGSPGIGFRAASPGASGVGSRIGSAAGVAGAPGRPRHAAPGRTAMAGIWGVSSGGIPARPARGGERRAGGPVHLAPGARHGAPMGGLPGRSGPSGLVGVSLSSSTGSLGGAGNMRGPSRAARQLDALLQVAAAAARVLDPDELARLALDETVRILNAERALLFLTNENAGGVRPHLGRDAAGNDLDEITNYSSTVVDRVATTREPLVLTGTEEGAALGSASAVTHGLRSILVAPLQIEERLLGVVYLDSRLAKGIFTRDDVEILAAITSHVAFALETARIAEMELSVATERRQREVAELLRDSMRKVGQSLDPRGVLASILETSVAALAADAGAVLLANGERLEVAAVTGSVVGLPAGGYDIARSDQPEIAEALRNKKPLAVSSVISERNSPLFGLLGRAGSFVVAPLVVRDAAVGALVMVSRKPSAFGQAQTEVTAALAGQGVVAYENAQLFSKVQNLAQRDELSGVANRRYFFEVAARCFKEAKDNRTPLSAMMLDIDYFKSVNDRFGHASGDDVIREVAHRISSVIGSGDVLGRYGGEEFALVVKAPLREASELAGRLRQVISETPVNTAAGAITVTASVGVAELSGADEDLGRLLQRTDAALYEAKRAGRDRVRMAGS